VITRRRFLKAGAAAGSAMFLPWGTIVRHARAAIPGGTLDPRTIPKHVTPLVVPPAMPRTRRIRQRGGKNIDYYDIAVRQFRQQILPPSLPRTKVWGYGSVNHPATFNYPAFTIEAKWEAPVRVNWINGLVDRSGNFLPHLLPVDPTLHWANPPGGEEGRDMRPELASTPGQYEGPVPIVVHLHGGHSPDWADGFSEAWYLPAAANIPSGYAAIGTWHDAFRRAAQQAIGVAWDPGSAVFQYPNDQRASTLWFHDHTLGLTRLNVYAGPAGFYLLRGGPGDRVLDTKTGTAAVLPGPAPAMGDPPGIPYYEIPLAIQDRSFNEDGSLFYPGSREFFDGFDGPYIPDSDVSPIWNPEVFANTIVVNGRTWPYLDVEPRRYRFRILNGCNARFLILKMSRGPSFWQIGSEGGFLPAPVELETLLLGPAERADVIVDFSSVPVGTEIVMRNLGPDEPFGGGAPGEEFEPSDRRTTGQVMLFRVIPSTGADPSTPVHRLQLPPIVPLGPADRRRRVSLNEDVSELGDFPVSARLGTINRAGEPVARGWDDPITENPALDSVEIWEIHNFTEDAHPIHIHEVQFEVVDRKPYEGTRRGPEPWETGFKDTVIAYPEEITRVKAKFDVPGLFAWHCHIVEHEDNEMMRPYFIGDAPASV